jgi:hypothetical protein
VLHLLIHQFRAGPSLPTLGGYSEIFWTRKFNFAIFKRRKFFLLTNVKNFLILLSKKNKIFEDWGVVTTPTNIQLNMFDIFSDIVNNQGQQKGNNEIFINI